MNLEIGPELIGKKVSNAARLDWGVGTVLRVQAVRMNEAAAHRVSIQFPSGHRTLIVPPAKLIPPPGEVSREQGWLDKLAGQTTDDRLRKLPEEVITFLGSPAQRINAVLPLFRWTDDPAELERWASQQVQVADPLTLWTRDELARAFADFSRARDEYLREAALALRRSAGPEALSQAIAALEEPLRTRVQRALWP